MTGRQLQGPSVRKQIVTSNIQTDSCIIFLTLYIDLISRDVMIFIDQMGMRTTVNETSTTVLTQITYLITNLLRR